MCVGCNPVGLSIFFMKIWIFFEFVGVLYHHLITLVQRHFDPSPVQVIQPTLSLLNYESPSSRLTPLILLGFLPFNPNPSRLCHLLDPDRGKLRDYKL